MPSCPCSPQPGVRCSCRTYCKVSARGYQLIQSDPYNPNPSPNPNLPCPITLSWPASCWDRLQQHRPRLRTTSSRSADRRGGRARPCGGGHVRRARLSDSRVWGCGDNGGAGRARFPRTSERTGSMGVARGTRRGNCRSGADCDGAGTGYSRWRWTTVAARHCAVSGCLLALPTSNPCLVSPTKDDQRNRRRRSVLPSYKINLPRVPLSARAPRGRAGGCR